MGVLINSVKVRRQDGSDLLEAVAERSVDGQGIAYPRLLEHKLRESEP
jgi:hypothetical protein